MRRTGSASRRVAARSGLFWDPGLPRPDVLRPIIALTAALRHSRSVRPADGPAHVTGGLELLGEHQHPAAPPRRSASSRPARPVATMRAKAAARNSTSAKSPPAMPRSTSSTIAAQLVGAGRVGDAGDDPGDLGAALPGLELAPRRATRVGVHPRAQQEQPPQAAGQRVGGRARPDLGERLEALGLGEVHEPLGQPGRRDSRAPRTSSVAARSAGLAHQRRVGAADDRRRRSRRPGSSGGGGGGRGHARPGLRSRGPAPCGCAGR